MKRADALDTEVQGEQKQLDTQRLAAMDAREKPMEDIEGLVSRQEKAMAALQPPGKADLPPVPQKPTIDTKDFEQFSYALIGLALIGGVASHGDWLGVSSSMNGALKGLLEGNDARAQREYKDYEEKFQAAMTKHKEEVDEYNQVLNSKSLSINSMIKEMEILAAKNGREDLRFEARQRSLDGMRRQVDSLEQAATRAQEYADRTDTQLKIATQRMNAATSGKGGMKNLDGTGLWLVEQMAVGGNMQPMRMVQSRYGGELASKIFNDVGAFYQQNGIDPRMLSEDQLNIKVQEAAQRQITQRYYGVTRLTDSIKPIESELTRLVEKVNGKGATPVNATFNWIGKNIGNEDLAELKTLMGSLGRQYIEAITMPGSNAQLHATSQEWADGVFNENINIPNLQGTLRAMTIEIGSTETALKGQIDRSAGVVQSQGPTLPVPGATPGAQPARPVTPTPQMSDEELLKKYGG